MYHVVRTRTYIHTVHNDQICIQLFGKNSGNTTGFAIILLVILKANYVIPSLEVGTSFVVETAICHGASSSLPCCGGVI